MQPKDQRTNHIVLIMARNWVKEEVYLCIIYLFWFFLIFVPGSAAASNIRIPTLTAETNMKQKRRFQNKALILT